MKQTTLRHYFNEVFEAFISIVIVTLVTRHKFEIEEVVKLSFIIGSITFFLEFYDHSVPKTLMKSCNTPKCITDVRKHRHQNSSGLFTAKERRRLY